MISRLFIIVLLFATACNSNTPTSDRQQSGKADTAIPDALQRASVQTVPLPDRNFDLEQFGENKIKNNHPLTALELKQLYIKEIDRPLSQYDLSDFKYYLLQEIYKDKEGKVVLISRNSEMENFAWLATYDVQNNLIDFKTVFYDEWAESAVRTTSIIRNNKIIISQFMLDFETGKENKKVNTFYINEALNFVADNS